MKPQVEQKADGCDADRNEPTWKFISRCLAIHRGPASRLGRASPARDAYHWSSVTIPGIDGS